MIDLVRAAEQLHLRQVNLRYVGGDVKKVTDLARGAQAPLVFSPDGSRLAFVSALQLHSNVANIGDVQRRLNRPDLAVEALTRGLAVADEIRAPVLQIELYEHLARAEAARGNFRAAYDWHQKYSALKDRTFNQQNSDRLNRLNAAYEATQREQQLAQMRQTKVQLFLQDLRTAAKIVDRRKEINQIARRAEG